MPAITDQGVLIVNTLSALPEMVDVDVMLDYKKDLLFEVLRSVAKVKGAAIVVSAASGRIEDPDDPEITLKTTFHVTIITNPKKRANKTGANELLEASIKALQSLALSPSQHCTQNLRLTGWNQINDPTYNIHNITLTTTTYI